MKISTLTFFIGIVLGITTFIIWVIYENKGPGKKGKAGKVLLKILALIIAIFPIIKLGVRQARGFDLADCQSSWEKYHLPQIDRYMPLRELSGDYVRFRSISKDSVRHDLKSIEYDLFDIYLIRDVFENQKKKQTLTIEFIKPNIIRDSSRYITLREWKSKGNWKFDTLSRVQCDSVLISWGLLEDAYKKLVD